MPFILLARFIARSPGGLARHIISVPGRLAFVGRFHAARRRERARKGEAAGDYATSQYSLDFAHVGDKARH